MDQPPVPVDPGNGSLPGGRHNHPADDWAEILTRTVGHLAAQLTIAQVRLRALATELHARGAVDPDAVAVRVGTIAAAETAGYLRENLGEALVDVIDVDALTADLIAFLRDPDNA